MLFIMSRTCAFGQETNTYRQFLTNPFLVNPAFVAMNGYTQLSVAYRKQWVNIPDAPRIAAFTFEYATTSSFSLGFKAQSVESIGFRNTSLLATTGYKMRLASRHFLFAALSAGAMKLDNNLEDGDYDPDDPAIANTFANSFNPAADFGIVYKAGSFNVGFSLPSIFHFSFMGYPESNYGFSLANEQIYSVSKPLAVSPSVVIEPFAVIKNIKGDFSNWDAGASFAFKDNFIATGTYGVNAGIAISGTVIFDKLRINYAYELPPVQNDFIKTNSHEINISFRFGEKKECRKWSRKVLISAVDDPSEETKDSAVAINTEAVEVVPQRPVQPEPKVQSPTDKLSKKTDREEVETDRTDTQSLQEKQPAKTTVVYHVIIASFKVQDNAVNFILEKKRTGVDVKLVQQMNNFYVSVFSSSDLEKARIFRDSVRKRGIYPNSWVLTSQIISR